MRLEVVLPELMGSLTLSELLFRGEGPPWAWNRMDQYHRKMRKPVGSETHRSLGGETLSGLCSCLRVPQGPGDTWNDSLYCGLPRVRVSALLRSLGSYASWGQDGDA